MQKKQTKIWMVMAILAVAVAMSMPASAQTVKSQIQRMPGWQSCDACAGANGAGPKAGHSMAEGIKSPSMSGAAAQFNISGSQPYSDALWWKQLGPANSATNLVYDLYFYIKNPAASQALEFDANQANGSHRWVFGTQCNLGSHHWDVWANAAGKWTSTGIACSAPTAYKWHHLTWEFKRNATQVIFVAFTYDGVKHYVNRTYPAKTSGTNELNVAFQMDQKGTPVAYSTWLDNVTLRYW